MSKCPNCGYESDSENKFCPKCGQKQTIKCPKCGNETSSENDFCPECGNKLSGNQEDYNKSDTTTKIDPSQYNVYGKQKKKSGGMWYTPVSGIWQSIWLEAVQSHYIQDLKITPSLDQIHLHITACLRS